MRVAAGAVCKHFLAQFAILVGGYVASIGAVQADFGDMPYEQRFLLAEESDVRCPVEEAASRMQAEIEKTIRGKNTLGGVLEIVALNLPVGLGSFVQWDKRLEARLAMAVMSVQAIKGVEVGDAFENARRIGTEAHDPMHLDGQKSKVERLSNRAGGTEGGISNGQPIILRAAMKPIATTLTPQQTVDLAAGENAPTHYERSDFCPVPRAVPILEAMVAFILADALIEKLGGDSMNEMEPRFDSLRKATLKDLAMDNTAHIYWE
jgi:chorismate synthase